MEAVRDGEQGLPLNRDVLQLVFKMLSHEDLKSCRHVCKEWCQESTAVMRQVVPEVKIPQWSRRIGRTSPSDFLELMRVDGEDNPVSVAPFKVHLYHYLLEELPREFWRHCGSSITDMCLGTWSLSGGAFRNAVFQYCVNLEELKICVNDGQSVEEPSEWVPSLFPPNRNLKVLELYGGMMEGVSWKEIFSQFPALEKVKAENDVGSFAGFFHSLAIARNHDDQCWKLKHLSFSLGRISTPLAVVPVLHDLKQSLKTLQIKDIDRSEDVTAVQSILATHFPTLEDLSLSGGCELSSTD